MKLPYIFTPWSYYCKKIVTVIVTFTEKMRNGKLNFLKI